MAGRPNSFSGGFRGTHSDREPKRQSCTLEPNRKKKIGEGFWKSRRTDPHT